MHFAPAAVAAAGIQTDGRCGDEAIPAAEQRKLRRVMLQRDPGLEENSLDDGRCFAEALDGPAALDKDDVGIDALIGWRKRDGASALKRNSWCFTMRAAPLQNWQCLISCLSAMPVRGMFRIGRPAVGIDSDIEAARFHRLLARVVAASAKALQRAECEQIPVAAMRLLVIDMVSGSDDAIIRAEFAQRMRQQLLLAAALPEG